MTLAIAHKTPEADEMIVIDAIREARPPFSPEAVVDEFAALCELYGITQITGDHFGGEFVKEPFRTVASATRSRNSPSPTSTAICCRCSTVAERPGLHDLVAQRRVFDLGEFRQLAARAFCASSCPVARSPLRNTP